MLVDILHTIVNPTVFEWSKFVARFTRAARNSPADYHLLIVSLKSDQLSSLL